MNNVRSRCAALFFAISLPVLIATPQVKSQTQLLATEPSPAIGSTLQSFVSNPALIQAGVSLELWSNVASDRSLVQMLRQGSVDLIAVDLRSFEENGAYTALLAEPLIFRSTDDFLKAQASMLGVLAKNELSERGFIPLAMFGAGRSAIMSTSVELVSPDDFQRVTVASNSAIGREAVERFGAQALGLPAAEVYSALQTGAADAVEINIDRLGADLLSDYSVKSIADGFSYNTHVLVARPKWWRGLTARAQAAVRLASHEARNINVAELRERQGVVEGLAASSAVRYTVLQSDGAAYERTNTAFRKRFGLSGSQAVRLLESLREPETSNSKSDPENRSEVEPTSPPIVLFATDRRDDGLGEPFDSRFANERGKKGELHCGLVGYDA